MLGRVVICMIILWFAVVVSAHIVCGSLVFVLSMSRLLLLKYILLEVLLVFRCF